jgi:thiamine monophosphate synthase
VKNNKLDYYIFIEELNEIIARNIIKLKQKKIKIHIICTEKSYLIITKFSKKNKIPLYFVDNLKLAIQYKAKGIFLTSSNKSLKSNIKRTTKLEVIGSAHNQFEYSIKKRQRCSTIMLSPIFYNIKYSLNKILTPIKFNLITLNWDIKVCALGGINNKNIKLINLTKSKSIGVKSLILK